MSRVRSRLAVCCALVATAALVVSRVWRRRRHRSVERLDHPHDRRDDHDGRTDHRPAHGCGRPDGRVGDAARAHGEDQQHAVRATAVRRRPGRRRLRGGRRGRDHPARRDLQLARARQGRSGPFGAQDRPGIVWPIGGIFVYSGGAPISVEEHQPRAGEAARRRPAGDAMFRDDARAGAVQPLRRRAASCSRRAGKPVPPPPLFTYRAADAAPVGGTPVERRSTSASSRDSRSTGRGTPRAKRLHALAVRQGRRHRHRRADRTAERRRAVRALRRREAAGRRGPGRVRGRAGRRRRRVGVHRRPAREGHVAAARRRRTRRSSSTPRAPRSS